MEKFKLIKYDSDADRYLAERPNGERIYLDLTTDSSFPEINNTDEYRNCNSKETFKIMMEKLEGKWIECESIAPYISCYFVGNGKFIK